jgi:hypothetical protein
VHGEVGWIRTRGAAAPHSGGTDRAAGRAHPAPAAHPTPCIELGRDV